MEKKNEDGEDLNQIMKTLIEIYGIEILQNVGRTKALLMDYAPHSEKERKLIIMVMREGIVSQLMGLVDKDESNQNFVINKCVNQLVADIWITEAAARYAISVLAGAIGLTVTVKAASTESGNINTENQAEKGQTVLTKDMELSSESSIKVMLSNCDAIGYKGLAANKSIKELTVPENIRHIYPKALLNCVSLQKIVLPRGLKKIGRCAFEGCSSLQEIVICDNAIYKIRNGILVDQEGKKAIRAENKEGLSKIVIANGVTTVCKKCFDHNLVREIEIPASVDTLEENAFFLTMNLEKFNVDRKNRAFRTFEGVLHDSAGKVLVRYPQGKPGISYYLEDSVEEIGLQAFSCAKNIETITFTGTLKKIGEKAFEYCLNLETMMIPGSVEIIGDRAFQFCEKLKGVMLSRSIKEIGDCAFYNCISLETISVPKAVEKIGNLAFAKCRNLKKVTIQDNVAFIGDGAFAECGWIEVSVRNNPYVESYCHAHGIMYNKM